MRFLEPNDAGHLIGRPYMFFCDPDHALMRGGGSTLRSRGVVMPFLLFLFLMLYTAEPIRAQERPRYTFVVMGAPLSEAFDQFIEQSGISVAFEIDLVESKVAYCRAVDQDVEGVLACLLKDTGLDFIRLSSGTYVLIKQAQAPTQYGRITGRVVDIESGEPLSNAHVLLADAGIGDVTNGAGRFAFNQIKPGLHRLVVTYLGYKDAADTVNVAPERNALVEMKMRVEPLLSAPIVVNGLINRFSSEGLYTEESAVGDLSGAGLQRDVIRSMNTIIGVRVGDVLADVHVQGGDTGEHQYRLDSAPVFVPISSGGIFGPFSPFALDKFTVHKAGFSAAKGSHLSGVIEASHTLTPVTGNNFDVQVDQLSVNARALGTVGDLSRVGMNWMLAARKSLWALVQPRGLQAHFDNWNATDLHVLNALFPREDPHDLSDRRDNVRFNYLQNVSKDGRQNFDVNDFGNDFGFYDLHGAMRLHLGAVQSLNASFYRGGNRAGGHNLVRGGATNPAPAGGFGALYFNLENGYEWLNNVAQVKYEHILGDRTFAEWGGWISEFDGIQRFDHNIYNDPFRLGPPDSTHYDGDDYYPESDSLSTLKLDYHDRNTMREIGMRVEVNHAVGARTFLTGGLEATNDVSRFDLNLQGVRTDVRLAPNQAEVETSLARLAAYLDNSISISRQSTLDAGIRLTYLGSHGQVYAEPRIGFRYDAEHGILGPWAFRGAVGLYRQFINQFDITAVNRNALMPSMRFWLPLDATQDPAKAYHATGALLLMPKKNLELRIEGYYKWQPHLLLIDYANPALFGSSASILTTQDDLLHAAKGFAYGAAIALEKKSEFLNTKIQYEYSVAEQQVSNRFEGRYVGVPWNVPHRITGALSYRAGERILFIGRIESKIGQSWAFRGAYYNFLEPDPVLGNLGSFDLSNPTSHKLPIITYLDLGISYSQPLKNANLQARLDLSNLLSFRNVEEWSLAYDPVRNVIFKEERPLTPFLPSIVVRLGF